MPVELLGLERTLFVPSNTMANLISGEHRVTSVYPAGPQCIRGAVTLVDHIPAFLFGSAGGEPWKEMGEEESGGYRSAPPQLLFRGSPGPLGNTRDLSTQPWLWVPAATPSSHPSGLSSGLPCSCLPLSKPSHD